MNTSELSPFDKIRAQMLQEFVQRLTPQERAIEEFLISGAMMRDLTMVVQSSAFEYLPDKWRLT